MTALLDDDQPARRIDATRPATVRFERAEPAGPMAVESLRATIAALLDDLEDPGAASVVRAAALTLVERWSTAPSGEALASFASGIGALGGTRMRNGTELARAVRHLVVSPAWRDDHGRQMGLRLLDEHRGGPAPTATGSRMPSSGLREPVVRASGVRRLPTAVGQHAAVRVVGHLAARLDDRR